MRADQTTNRVCVELSLQVTTGNIRIVANPEELEIEFGQSVCWTAQVQEGDRVKIDFEQAYCGDKLKKGPFAEAPDRPDPGSYERSGPGPIESTRADCAGRWKYSVKWRRDGWKEDNLDPYIIVRG